MQIILGIDPGYDRMGWCVLHKDGSVHHILASGCVETKKTDHMYTRYAKLQSGLEVIIREYHPTVCAIENLFFAKNVKTAMQVSEARGIIIGAVIGHKIDIVEYTPNQIKSALTGNGHATKADIARMMKLLTKRKELPKLDDEVDAIAVALCHSYSGRMKGMI